MRKIWILWHLVFTLFVAFQFSELVLAHGDEDHGTETADVQSENQNVKQATQTVQTSQGTIKLTLRQIPSSPQAGEEVQFELKAVELVEGGLAGGELPLTDAQVTANLRAVTGKVLTANLNAHQEDQPAVYGVHFTFEDGGGYVLGFSVKTGDDRLFSDEFPITVQPKPINYVALGIQTLVVLIGLVLIGRNLFRAQVRSLPIFKRLTVHLAANFIIVAVTIGVVFGVGRWTPSIERREITQVQAASEDASNVLEVGKEAQLKFKILTDVARQEQIRRTVVTNGNVMVRPQFKAEVMSPVAGKILAASNRYTVGDLVKEGTVLAVVEQTLPAQDAATLELNRLQVQNDRTRLESEARQSQKRLDQAVINLQRAERLYTLQAISLKELQQTQLEKQIADDDIKRATKQLEVYQAPIGVIAPTRRFEVRSPVSGVIVSTALTPGEVVETTKVLFLIEDLNRMWIEAQVYEKDLAVVTGSKTASFTLESYPGELFEINGNENGRLVTVGSTVDPQTRTIPVIYEVDNRQGKLKNGMFARVLVISGQSVDAVTVPKSGVYDDAGRQYIYVFLGGEKFEQREVIVGTETTDRIEIKSGLKADERIVVNGLRQLRNVALQGGNAN